MIAVVVVLPWAEERVSKAKNRLEAKIAAPKASVPKASARRPSSPSAPAVQPAPSAPFLPPEGERVTSDIVPGVAAAAEEPPTSCEELRKAVLWSEILKPKF